MTEGMRGADFLTEGEAVTTWRAPTYAMAR
jgi:hypothetical protein